MSLHSFVRSKQIAQSLISMGIIPLPYLPYSSPFGHLVAENSFFATHNRMWVYTRMVLAWILVARLDSVWYDRSGQLATAPMSRRVRLNGSQGRILSVSGWARAASSVHGHENVHFVVKFVRTSRPTTLYILSGKTILVEL